MPSEIARALYVRAMRRALHADVRDIEQLYLRWLRAAAERRPTPPPPTPGRQTPVMHEARRSAGAPQLPGLDRLGPGKWTRVLLEAIEPAVASARVSMSELLTIDRKDAHPPTKPHAPDTDRRLPADVLDRMEQAYGQRFDDVEIHYDSAEVPTGQQAFTRGRHIYFEIGAFDPSSEHGEHVVAHELAHVAQQSRLSDSDRPAPRAALEADAHQI